MWEIDIKLQLLAFLRSVGLGVIFCILYDVLRAIRKIGNSSDILVFAEDILYFLICAPITFCFLLATTNGELRGFVFFGIISGFLLMRITVSKYILNILIKVFKIIRKVFLLINHYFGVFIDLLVRIFTQFSSTIAKFFKKALKIVKKLLKKR